MQNNFWKYLAITLYLCMVLFFRLYSTGFFQISENFVDEAYFQFVKLPCVYLKCRRSQVNSTFLFTNIFTHLCIYYLSTFPLILLLFKVQCFLQTISLELNHDTPLPVQCKTHWSAQNQVENTLIPKLYYQLCHEISTNIPERMHIFYLHL